MAVDTVTSRGVGMGISTPVVPDHGTERAAEHRRGLSGRAWVAAALAGETVVLALLTVWLFPSLWSVLRAVVDIDQSAGSDKGVNLTEVANHPEVMWGRTVTISAEVADLLGPQAMVIGNDALFVGDELLVLGAAPLDALLVEPGAGPIRETGVVRVTGEVRRLDPAALASELGGGLDATMLQSYDGKAALVAGSVELDPPAHPGPGDKEFASMTDGYDVGVTVYDVTEHTEEHLGETVVVSGEVEEHLLTPHVFLLGDWPLLVVSGEPHPDLFVEATAYVTGEVRRFDLAAVEAELGVDLPDERVASFAGEPVVIARAVELVA